MWVFIRRLESSDGLINKTLMDGFNGIVDFIEVVEQKMIVDKLIDG